MSEQIPGIVILAVALATGLVQSPLAVAQEGPDHIGHRRHEQHHGDPHPTSRDVSRFTTSRTGAELPLPSEEDAFFFAIFGDRTGGPVDGVSVLANAVYDVNLLEPDLVMTVGDLVQGYNQTEDWMWQMREYRSIMDQLLCPWFPVVGNHDVYFRGPNKPVGEHEKSYELHFGPLWYAFEHKNCWFIALYSDEGNPATGEKNFGKPECQRMSPEQFGWLEETLTLAKGGDHVFLFLHHPRWLGGNYGDDWERVHELLVSSGNVTAVFGGHIHQMRYDPKDGIEYVTLATTGGEQSGLVPEVGWLHHFNLVTVRKDQVAFSALPVGQVMDVRAITGELVDQAALLARLRPEVSGELELGRDGAVSGEIVALLENPSTRPIEVTLGPDTADSRWSFQPDHQHPAVAPGKSVELVWRFDRPGGSLDGALCPVNLVLDIDLLAEGFRYAIPSSATRIPLDLSNAAPPVPAVESVLAVDGRGAHLPVPSAKIAVPDGPFTLECWMRADSFGERVGLVTKTEMSEYGFFVNSGRPSFSVHLGGNYALVADEEFVLEPGGWHHLAAVYDGTQVRLYVDGELISAQSCSGTRRRNDLPLMIGADVDGNGNATSPFQGEIDAVRLSTVARYAGEHFQPARRHDSDEDTALLLNMDGAVGPWMYDESPRRAHPPLRAGARVVVLGE